MKLLKKIFSKRFILFFLVFVFSLGIFLTKTELANAAGTLFPDINTYKQTVQQANQPGGAQQSLETWTYNVGYNMVYAVSDWLLCIYSCPAKQGSSGIGQSGGGLQGMLAGAIGTMYSKPPASGVEYLVYLKSNIGVGQQAYAVGKGTDLLDPIVLQPWQTFRNAAYVFFVIIFVAIGFMIMFRFKINPQIVASVQDSLPKIVFALILVTLSYVIAGFMIDIAWVGNELIKNLVSPGGANQIFGNALAPFANPANPAPSAGAQDYPSAWPFDILNIYGGGSGKGGTGVVSMMMDALGKILIGATTGSVSLGFSGLFGMILSFTVVGATIKIFFSLLTKYVTLIVMTIFLPFSFLWGSLPGQEDTGSKSIMTMLSAALAFPAVTLFLSLAYYFAKISVTINEIPPLYYQNAFGAAAGSDITSSLVAIGILTIIPSIPSVIDDALAVKGGGLGAGVEELGGAIKKLPIIGSFLG